MMAQTLNTADVLAEAERILNRWASCPWCSDITLRGRDGQLIDRNGGLHLLRCVV